MMRARLRHISAVLLLPMAMALAGCGAPDDGGSDTDDGIASASSASPEPDSNIDAPLDEDKVHQQQLDFAQCLRDNGIDVEDPAPGEGIHIQNEGDPSQADAAVEACEHLAPPPPSGGDPEGEREDMLAFAKCMRDNGVEEFADPRPGQGINIGPEIVEDPDFPAAEETCDSVLGSGERRVTSGGGSEGP